MVIKQSLWFLDIQSCLLWTDTSSMINMISFRCVPRILINHRANPGENLCHNPPWCITSGDQDAADSCMNLAPNAQTWILDSWMLFNKNGHRKHLKRQANSANSDIYLEPETPGLLQTCLFRCKSLYQWVKGQTLTVIGKHLRCPSMPSPITSPCHVHSLRRSHGMSRHQRSQARHAFAAIGDRLGRRAHGLTKGHAKLFFWYRVLINIVVKLSGVSTEHIWKCDCEISGDFLLCLLHVLQTF